MQMHFKANRVTEKKGEAAEGGKRRLSLTKRDEDAGLVNLKSLPQPQRPRQYFDCRDALGLLINYGHALCIYVDGGSA